MPVRTPPRSWMPRSRPTSCRTGCGTGACCRLEEGVRRLTSDTASFIGYRDRGVVAEGAFADLNVIDLDGLALELPEIVRDFPGGAPGSCSVLVGSTTRSSTVSRSWTHGEHTGALSGRLLRSTD